MAGLHFGFSEVRHEDDEGREYCSLALVFPLKRDDGLKHDNCLKDGDGDRVAHVMAGGRTIRPPIRASSSRLY